MPAHADPTMRRDMPEHVKRVLIELLGWRNGATGQTPTTSTWRSGTREQLKDPGRMTDRAADLMFSLGLSESMTDLEFWAAYRNAAVTARDAMTLLVREQYLGGISRPVIEAAIMACDREAEYAAEEAECAKHRGDDPS